MSFPYVHPQHDAHQSIFLKNNVESWLMVRCWGFNRPKEEQIACMDHLSRTLPPRTPLVFNAFMKTSTLWIFCKKQQQKKLKTEQVCLVLRADWDYSAVEIVDKYLKTISFILQLHSNSHFFLMLSTHLQSGDGRNTKGCWKLPILSEKLHNAPV